MLARHQHVQHDLDSVGALLQGVPPSNDAGVAPPSPDQQTAILAVAKLKVFLPTNGDKLIKWVLLCLFDRLVIGNNKAVTRDPVNDYLMQFLLECLLYLQDIDQSALDTVFEIASDHWMMRDDKVVFMLCFVADAVPAETLGSYHRYMVGKLAKHAIGHDQRSTETQIGDALLSHLIDKHPAKVRKATIDLFDVYLTQVSDTDTPMLDENDVDRYILIYLIAMTHWFPAIVDVCWSDMITKLFHNNTLINMVQFEQRTLYSQMHAADGTAMGIEKVLASWLGPAFFDGSSAFMRHAMDVAIVFDRLSFAVESSGQARAWMHASAVHFEKAQMAALDLVDDWLRPSLREAVKGDNNEETRLELPLKLMQHVIQHCAAMDKAMPWMIKLMSRLDYTCNPTLVHTLLEAVVTIALSHWPNFVESMLEQLFAQAMALNVRSNGTGDESASATVERILGNTAALFDVGRARAGSAVFSEYMATHWSQVMLLFLNDPSSQCRGVGYQLLGHSRFWTHANVMPSKEAVCKVLVENWFRLLRNRYLVDNGLDRDIAMSHLQALLVQCVQDASLTTLMLSALMDAIQKGSLEKIPRADVTNDTTSLLDRIVLPTAAADEEMPRSIPHVHVLASDIKSQDKIYMDNIDLTIEIFKSAMAQEGIGEHVVVLMRQWFPTTPQISVQVYDEALPHNIPYPHDISNGCAFKDHPVLFSLLALCKPTAPETCMAILRSVLIYFIAFWNMDAVAASQTTLDFATQLDETTQLWHWMRDVRLSLFLFFLFILELLPSRRERDEEEEEESVRAERKKK
ncbi:hypothetical protein BC940DRAFT_300120 [Gongronella butleri]|nr:hypothetical protein BC940DRAFT_300120 [Gongronella butleri]